MDDRTPTPDPAEHNAFFPSPYSLSQYTASKTDFDGLVTEERYRGSRWRVLVIAADERYMSMRNGTFFSTGNHPVETLLPLHHLMEAGYGVDIATVTGGPAKFEWWAYPGEDAAVQATWDATQESFRAPKVLADVLASGLEDYAAIFIPGGHAAMNGLPFHPEVGTALRSFLQEDRAVITLCHGPAALLAAGIDQDANPFAGYEITAFPDALDFGANIEIGYIPGEMPWALGERLGEAGIVVTNEEMTGATRRDRNVLTGDSPLAANQLGQDAVTYLLEHFAG